jgi:CCR4-NOT transcription complex subunit 7/8
MINSGYDFGYLLKILTCSPMPAEEGDFFELLRTYFPCIYDIKYLMKSCKNLKGGLQELANDLQVPIQRPSICSHIPREGPEYVEY